MPDKESDPSDRSRLLRRALSRWENEGGASAGRLHSGSIPGKKTEPDVPPLENAELVQLQVRVIALENVVLTLLAGASDREFDLVREMAAYISPRQGFTPHHLTTHAAAEMLSLVERAGRFRDVAL